MEQKIDNGIKHYIDKVTKENKLAMLINDYNNAESEEFKQECFVKIKTILVEMYGVTGLMINTTSKSKYKI